MSQMKPPLWCLNWSRTFTILHLHNRVIVAWIDNDFFLNFGMCDVFHQSPSDATTRTCVDETILWTGVESIHAIHELRMQDNVSLLTFRYKVGQTLPRFQIFGACNTSSGSGSTEIAGLRIVMTLGTEDTIYPSILVLSKAHVIDIGSRNCCFGHCYGFGPETEIIDSIWTFSNGKERLTIGTFHPANQQISSVHFYGTCIQDGVHHDALHQIGIILFVKVISPLQRGMFSRQYGMLVAFEYSVTQFLGLILQRKQSLVIFLYLFQS